MTIPFRLYRATRASDVDLVVRLLKSVRSADGIEMAIAPEELRLNLIEGMDGWSVDTRFWLDDSGTPVAMASCQIPVIPAFDADRPVAYLQVQVDPLARETALPTHILAWFRERTLADLGETALVETNARLDETWKTTWMTAAGVRPDRHFLRMRRQMDQPVPPVEIPEGYAIRTSQEGEDPAPWVDAINLAFADHYDWHPNTVEQWRQYHSGPDSRPDYDLAAIAPDGTMAGLCICGRETTDDGVQWWVYVVGTTPPHRGKGLGRALLRAGLHRLAADGSTSAMLGVDSDNAYQPDRLYRSEGFVSVYTTVVYRCPVTEFLAR